MTEVLLALFTYSLDVDDISESFSSSFDPSEDVLPNRIRVRELIKYLHYNSLVQEGIIPDLKEFLLEKESLQKAVRFPPMVYKNTSMDLYGMFMDYLVRRGFTDLLKNKSKCLCPESGKWGDIYYGDGDWKKTLVASYKLASRDMGKDTIDLAEIKRLKNSIFKRVEDLAEDWKKYRELKGDITYEAEIFKDDLEGHPDIICGNAVLDIKTSSKFINMSEESILQVLCYYVLMKETNVDTRYVGFVLPMTKEVILYDLLKAKWNHEKFRTKILHVAKCLRNMKKNPEKVISTNKKVIIGSHCNSDGNLYIALKKYKSDNPDEVCQFRISGKLSGKMSSKTIDDADKIKKILTTYKGYIHTPYTINLCANKPRDQKILNNETKFGKKIKSKGVVVHIGSITDKHTETEGINNIVNTVRKSLKYASSETPILLETSCGEGNEICFFLEDIIKLFELFTIEERSKLGLCVDTCHVFALGYNPVTFIQRWLREGNVSLKLVHYNDSSNPRYSRKDNHAPSGYIGRKTMNDVALLCTEHNIDMVIE